MIWTSLQGTLSTLSECPIALVLTRFFECPGSGRSEQINAVHLCRPLYFISIKSNFEIRSCLAGSKATLERCLWKYPMSPCGKQGDT